MNWTSQMAIVLVAVGALFLCFSLRSALKTWRYVPRDLYRSWHLVIGLMGFFLLGYIFFDFVLFSNISFPVEIVTGCIFFGGAIFAFIITNLSHQTISKIRSMEVDFQSLNESLEQRVSERTLEAERAYDLLLNSRQTLQTILDSMPYGVVIIGRDKKVRNANAAALALMNYDSENEIRGQICNSTLCPAEEGKCPILDLHEELDRSERLLITKHGQEVPILKTVVPVVIDGEEVLLEAMIDITERKLAEDRIRFLAYFDSLTNLPNRTFSTEYLTRALATARRHDQPLATLFIDLDSFKRINDTLGHAIGDELLQTVAERLLKSVRECDFVSRTTDVNISNTVARLGGDEFIVMLPEIRRGFDAGIVAQRILRDLETPFLLSGHEVFITASLGISLFPTDGKDVDTLLKNADTAMYHAKAQGKNNFQFYNESMNSSALDRLRLENELHKALERREFQLYFQPRISIQSGQVAGREALVRWHHPDRGVLPPSDFIPLAEETGLIMPIGEWILQTACQQGKAWLDGGMQDLSISVNISKRQLEQDHFVETVLRILKETGLPPHLLELEITESMIMQNPQKVVAMLGELKSKGIMISIDDFGTGYSSLEYLKRLPLDTLKIDRSFIRNITFNADDAAIVNAIIAMAKSLKLKVVAEGVETLAQLDFLRGLHCEEAQGDLIGKPAAETEHLISA